MDRYPDRAGRVRPGARIALLGGLLALELACAAPADAGGKQDAVDVRAIVAEFRQAGVDKMRTMVARNDLLPLRFFRSEGMMAGPYIQLEMDLE
jgi:hypothetical protein